MSSPKDKLFLTIGKITGSHGIQGVVKLVSYAESIESFAPGTSVLLKRADGTEQEYTIFSSRPYKTGVLLKLEGMDSADEVNEWRGAEVLLKRTSLKKLDDGTYYCFQIIGLKVFTIDDQFLGEVADVMRTGSNDVYVVSNQSKEVLIPAIESVIVKIDLEKQEMRVNPPEGLLDL